MSPEEFRQRRTALGLTQKALADELAVHPLSVSKWERGIGQIPVPIAKLMTLLRSPAAQAVAVTDRIIYLPFAPLIDALKKSMKIIPPPKGEIRARPVRLKLDGTEGIVEGTDALRMTYGLFGLRDGIYINPPVETFLSDSMIRSLMNLKFTTEYVAIMIGAESGWTCVMLADRQSGEIMRLWSRPEMRERKKIHEAFDRRVADCFAHPFKGVVTAGNLMDGIEGLDVRVVQGAPEPVTFVFSRGAPLVVQLRRWSRSEEVECTWDHEPLTIHFNAQYLLDYLAVVPPKMKLTLLLKDARSPMMMVPDLRQGIPAYLVIAKGLTPTASG